MVKKNNNFKFKGSAKRVEKKSRKTKSGFFPYDDSLLFRNEESAEDLVRNYLRDAGSNFGRGAARYEDDYPSMW